MIRAVLFDVDGTLYHQAPLRAAMAWELGVVPCARRGFEHARVTWQVLRSFRRVRETLRAAGRPDTPLGELQFAETARRLQIDERLVRPIVEEWIFERPLRHVARFRRAGVGAALQRLDDLGVRAGVFSDYPAAGKLGALGISGAMGVQICATDLDVNAFKPHPRGFLAACERWGFSPAEVVYVGDRVDVDAAGAGAAGLACIIIGGSRRPPSGTPAPYSVIRSFSELPQALRRLGPFPSGVPAQRTLAHT